jgi:ABC-type transport system involved in multi-copper enzyme maturation permease subunit
MFLTLIQKELRTIILSTKFVGTFAVCSILILLSILVGIREYKTMENRYAANSELVEQELRQQTSWGRMTTKIYRAPDPMRIFVSGLDYDIGRWSYIANNKSVKLNNSAYSDEPIYAIFRFIDPAFIVQFILTLFAILLTYNSVSGEREEGTLRLVFSNSVSKAQYLIAKCIGSWLGLVIPICIPILLGILLIMIFNIPLTVEHWIRILLFLILSLLLFTCFIVMGVFISSLTKRSSVSFLTSLVVWVVLVMIVPRAGVMAAGNIIRIPRVAEIESQISGFSKELWEKFYAGMDQRFANMDEATSGESNISDDKLWALMQMEDSLRRGIEQEIGQYDLRLREDLRQRKSSQEILAMTLSRFSPASAFQLGSMSLAGTDIRMKSRYEETINEYRNRFCQFVEQKQKETGDQGGIMMAISIDEKGDQHMSVSGSRSKDQLDVSTVPRFAPPIISLAEAITPVIIDFGLLILFTFLFFAGSFVSFLRYDVR